MSDMINERSLMEPQFLSQMMTPEEYKRVFPGGYQPKWAQAEEEPDGMNDGLLKKIVEKVNGKQRGL